MPINYPYGQDQSAQQAQRAWTYYLNPMNWFRQQPTYYDQSSYQAQAYYAYYYQQLWNQVAQPAVENSSNYDNEELLDQIGENGVIVQDDDGYVAVSPEHVEELKIQSLLNDQEAYLAELEEDLAEFTNDSALIDVLEQGDNPTPHFKRRYNYHHTISERFRNLDVYEGFDELFERYSGLIADSDFIPKRANGAAGFYSDEFVETYQLWKVIQTELTQTRENIARIRRELPE